MKTKISEPNSNKPGESSKSWRSSARVKKISAAEIAQLIDKLLRPLGEEWWRLERIHPGNLIRQFMRRDKITEQQVASAAGISLEEITEILLYKRRVIPEFTERLERSFKWPAEVLDLWQDRYDLEKDLVKQEQCLAWAKLMRWCDHVLVAEAKSNIKLIKIARILAEKRIPVRLRQRRY